MNADVYTLPSMIPVPVNDLPMNEVPNVNNEEEEASVNIDNRQDGEIDLGEGQMNNPLLPQKNLYDYNEQEINDLLRPDEGDDYADVANNQLD